MEHWSTEPSSVQTRRLLLRQLRRLHHQSVTGSGRSVSRTWSPVVRNRRNMSYVSSVNPLMLTVERQSARMSKITNDSLNWSGTGCFIALYPYDNGGRQRVNVVCFCKFLSLPALEFDRPSIRITFRSRSVAAIQDWYHLLADIRWLSTI